MRRSLLCALAFVVGAGVGDAGAQSPPPQPPVELGLDVSALLFPDIREPHWGPRLVVNFDGRNSLQITTSFQRLTPWDDAQRKTDVYLAALRRRVYAAGRIRVSATLGGGLERTVIVASSFSRGLEVLPAFTTGAAIDYRLGRRAAVVFESSFVYTGLLGGRFSGGLVVPVGAY